MVKTRLAQILKTRGISTRELAEAIGCSPRSIHNESSKPKSFALRRRITAFLGVQVWDDVPISGLIHMFETDDRLEFADSKTARCWARQFNKLQSGVAKARGREVHYRTPITVMMSLIRPQTSKNLFTRRGDEIRVNGTCEIAVNLPPTRISAGTKVTFPTVKDARDSIAGLPPGIAKRRGRHVTFTVPATFADTAAAEAPDQSAENRTVSASSLE